MFGIGPKTGPEKIKTHRLAGFVGPHLRHGLYLVIM